MAERGLPDNIRLCTHCNEYTMRDRCPRCGRVLVNPQIAIPTSTIERVPRKEGKRSQPTETEQRFYNEFLREHDARFESVTFHMANGHKYTPDWVVFNDAGVMVECIEVKGGHKLGSYQRARLAFDQAKQEFKGPRWTWAEWDGKAKKWTVET